MDEYTVRMTRTPGSRTIQEVEAEWSETEEALKVKPEAFGINTPFRSTATVVPDGEREKKQVMVDMDTGAQVNTVCKDFARKRLRRIDMPLPTLSGASGRRIPCHGAYQARIQMTDAAGKERTFEQIFYAIRRDKTAPTLLLSRPGMGRQGIIIDTASDQWLFGNHEEVDPEEFAHMVLGGEQAFIANLTHIELQGELPIPEIDGDTGDAPVVDLPSCLEKFRHVYSEQAALELPLLAEAEHAIDLIEGAKVPFGPIYPTTEAQRK
ncbi:hypothetical protein GGR50DRAFT_699093, partial [Xylaria sp. CBS 124048]